MDLDVLIRNARAPLSRGDTESLFQSIFRGELTETQLIAYLTATADRKPSVDELVGAVIAMRAHMRPVAAPPGAIDLCGTGGDGLGTLNISTAVSFLVAAAGIPVAKHVNRSATSRSGAADVLEALGVRIGLEPEVAARVLEKTGIVFLFAQTHHPAMRHVGAARRAIGRRTIFNLLGPLANPAGVKRQVVGVFARQWVEPLAAVLGRLGAERAWVVHGDGLDELTTTGPSLVAEWDGSAVRTFEVTPQQAGLSVATLADLKGGDAQHNADALRAVLDAQHMPLRDAVLLGAAAALVIADRAPDLRRGVELAAAAVDSGAARGVLDKLVRISNGAI